MLQLSDAIARKREKHAVRLMNTLLFNKNSFHKNHEGNNRQKSIVA